MRRRVIIKFLAAATLVALAAPAMAQSNTVINTTALLAEHLSTCGGRARPDVEQLAIEVVESIGYANWLQIASWIHFQLDEGATNKFCSVSRTALAKLLVAGNHPKNDRVPAELDLRDLPRRVTLGCTSISLVATENKKACNWRGTSQ